MKLLVFYILLLFSGISFAQDSLFIKYHRFIENELAACRKSKNQLYFLDSLITLASNEKMPSKGNGERFFKLQHEKLIIYHINAGWVCRFRGDFDQALKYYDRGENYIDSLKKYELYGHELDNAIKAYYHAYEYLCFDTYREDTSLFYAWDCARFFPELNEEVIDTDTAINTEHADSSSIPSVPPVNHYGKIYLDDTLRFDHQFTLDSTSAAYFKSIKRSLLSHLSYKSFPEGMRALKYDQADTIILEINIQNDLTTIKRECKVVYANCHSIIRDYYLHLFSSMQFAPVLFPGNSVKFYVPIVIKPEIPNNYNKMDRIIISDDHYLIEYEKIKPITLD